MGLTRDVQNRAFSSPCGNFCLPESTAQVGLFLQLCIFLFSIVSKASAHYWPAFVTSQNAQSWPIIGHHSRLLLIVHSPFGASWLRLWRHYSGHCWPTEAAGRLSWIESCWLLCSWNIYRNSNLGNEKHIKMRIGACPRDLSLKSHLRTSKLISNLRAVSYFAACMRTVTDGVLSCLQLCQ